MASRESVFLLWSLFIVSLRQQAASTVGKPGTSRQWPSLAARDGHQGVVWRVPRDYPPLPEVAMTHVTPVACLCRIVETRLEIPSEECINVCRRLLTSERIPDNEVASHSASSSSSDPPDLPTYRQPLGFVSLWNQWQTRSGRKANGKELSSKMTSVTLYPPVSKGKPLSKHQGGVPLSPSIDAHHELPRPLVADTAAGDCSKETGFYPTPSNTSTSTSKFLLQLTPSNVSTTKLLSVVAPSNTETILSHTTSSDTLSHTISSDILSHTTPSNTLSHTISSDTLCDTAPSNTNDKDTLSDTGPNDAGSKKLLSSTQTITSFHKTLYDRTHNNTLGMGSPSSSIHISNINIELYTPSKTMLSDTTTRNFILSHTRPLTSVHKETRPHVAAGDTRNPGLTTVTASSNQETLSRDTPGNASNMQILSDIFDVTLGPALCHPRKEAIAADVGDTKEGSSPGPNTQSSNKVQSLATKEIPLVHKTLTMASTTGILKGATPRTLGQHQLPDSTVFPGFQEKNHNLFVLKSSLLPRNAVTHENIILEEISTAFIAKKLLETVKVEPSTLTISLKTPASAINSEKLTFVSELSSKNELLSLLWNNADTINPSFAFANMHTIHATPAFDIWQTNDAYHHHRNVEDMQYNSGGGYSLNYFVGEHNLNVGSLTSSRSEDSVPQTSEVSIISLTSSFLEEQKELSVLPTPSSLLNNQLSSLPILTKTVVRNLDPIFLVSKQTKLSNSMEYSTESGEHTSLNIVAPNLSSRREVFVYFSGLSQGPETSKPLNEPAPRSGGEPLRENCQQRVSLVTTAMIVTDDSDANTLASPLLTVTQRVSSADPLPSATLRSDHRWSAAHTGTNTSTGTPLVPPAGVTMSQWIGGTVDTLVAVAEGGHLDGMSSTSFPGADDHIHLEVKSARRSERPASEAGQPTSKTQHVTHERSTSPALSPTPHTGVDKHLPARQSHALRVGAGIVVGLMCLSLVVMGIVHRSRRRELGRDGLCRHGRLLLQREDNIRPCQLRAPRWYPGYSRGGAAEGDWQRRTTRN